MKDTSAPADLFADATPAKTGSRKWILPGIFLVLVPILVAAAAFSSQAPNISGATNIALFVLTALLCTLVAVALTLAGCGEWLTRIEQNVQTMAAQSIAMHDTQVRLQEAVQKTYNKTVQEEGDRRLVQDSVTHLAGSIQTIVSHLTAMGAALQAHREASQTANTALAAGLGQLTGNLRQLHELTQTLASGLADAVRDQGALRSLLQDSAQAVQVAAGDLRQSQNTLQTKIEDAARTGQQIIDAVTGGFTQITQGQAAARGLLQDNSRAMTGLTEAVQQGQTAVQAKLDDVARADRQVIETVTGGLAGAAQEHAAVRGLLQDNARAVTAVGEVVQQSQGALQAKLEDAAHAGRQTVEMVTAMAVEQKAAQETVKHMVADITGAGANQVSLSEALRAHGDVINVAIAAFAASAERLTEDMRRLHEMTQTVAGGMTDVVREQAVAHNSLQQVMTGTTELIHQGQSTVQAKLEDIAGAGKQTIEAVAALAAEQRTGQETARRTLEEVTGLGSRQAADHGALQQALNGATEIIHQRHNGAQAKLEDIAGTARQTIEAVQAHREATNTGFSGLTSGQGQLTGDVRQLQELTRTVAGGVTDTAREQATAHGALHDTARVLTEATVAIQQNQQALRVELEKLAQSATQTIEAVHAVAAGQSTGREVTRRMIGELANAAIAALSTGHGPVPHLDRPLDVVARTVAGSGLLNIELPPPADEAASAPKLPAAQAIIHGEQMKYEAGPDRDNLGCWANPSEWVEWKLDVARPGRFKVTAEIAALASGRFQVLLGDQGLNGNAPSTGDYGRFQKVELGTVEVPAAGKTSLAVRPIPEGWQPMNLRSVELVPLA